MSVQLDELRLDLLRRASDDVVGLWEVWRVVKRLRTLPVEVQRREALCALKDLLDGGFIKAGQYSPSKGWVWWDIPTEEIITKIERDWQALAGEPGLGDVASFTSTPLGEKFVEGHPAL
jgi:hypothetical protein